MTDTIGFGSSAKTPIPTEGRPISNARLVAELQALTLGLHLVGLERLPEVMTSGRAASQVGIAAGDEPNPPLAGEA